jgi:hypothetical protein
MASNVAERVLKAWGRKLGASIRSCHVDSLLRISRHVRWMKKKYKANGVGEVDSDQRNSMNGAAIVARSLDVIWSYDKKRGCVKLDR